MSLMIDKTDPDCRPIAPSDVRYIKLGPGGAWEAASIDGGRIDWGNADDPHDLAGAGDWTGARQHYLTLQRTPSTATSYVRELRAFYELGADTLWITFARGSLWWAFAHPDVTLTAPQSDVEGSCFRRTIGPWRNTDITGQPLNMERLSTKLTQLAGYRRTICEVGAKDYLLRRINADDEPAVRIAREARHRLVTATLDLIRLLHQTDFELFVDLVFARSGWRRVSALGGTMKDIDLLIEQPATGERASVQVKSSANQSVLNASLAAFEASSTANRFFFVCHSPAASLRLPQRSSRPIHIWSNDRLAEAAVDQGLTNWLMARAS